jgi:8-oxo-dGTP pyrophosphatase MutT (NUDIX family)
MNREEVLAFLAGLGVPEANRAHMAEHALKRARQVSAERGIPEAEALGGVLRLLREGWAGRAGDAGAGIQPWPILGSRALHDYRIFQTRTERVRSPKTGREHDVYLLTGPDWVNVLAFTPAREVVLVQQYRHGSRQVMWEIPGGLMEPGEAPAAAGARELLEETGYAGDPAAALARIQPNPAFQTNTCHTVLIQNARLAQAPSPDAMEDLAVKLVPEEEFADMVADGRIANALVAVADLWRRLWREGKLRPEPPTPRP